MQRVFVQQVLNPEYIGPGISDDVDRDVYKVTKVINSITPVIGELLSCEDCAFLCSHEDCEVTIT